MKNAIEITAICPDLIVSINVLDAENATLQTKSTVSGNASTVVPCSVVVAARIMALIIGEDDTTPGIYDGVEDVMSALADDPELRRNLRPVP